MVIKGNDKRMTRDVVELRWKGADGERRGEQLHPCCSDGEGREGTKKETGNRVRRANSKHTSQQKLECLGGDQEAKKCESTRKRGVKRVLNRKWLSAWARATNLAKLVLSERRRGEEQVKTA